MNKALFGEKQKVHTNGLQKMWVAR